MLFSSLIFLWGFLPIVICLYYISEVRYRNVILLISSLFFYAWDEPIYVLLMMFSIIINYMFGILISKNYSRSTIIFAVLSNLFLICYFKYCPLFLELCNVLNIHVDYKSPVLPIGISFYTFQSISYLIDVYRKEIPHQRDFLKMGLFISFFPQLIAGPILKYHNIINQIERRNHSWKLFNSGACKFILGLSKKVLVANVMGETADSIFVLPIDKIGIIASWIGVFSYTMQIYFDFSGYSDMAIGLGRMFGFNIQKNFNLPYISRSIQEFWRRWHISLSTWFKEYLYIPLGGNRCSCIKNYRNLLIVFLCTGIWHGASLNFIIWGLFHGVFIILEKIIPIMKVLKFRILQRLYTMIVVMFGWIIFRISNLSDITKFMKACFINNYAIKGCHYLNLKFITTFILAIILCGGGYLMCNKFFTKETQLYFVRLFRPMCCVVLLFLCILALVKGSYNPFIYFRF